MNTRSLPTLTVLTLLATALGGCGPNLKALDDRLDFGDTFVGVPVTRSTAWVNRGGEAHIRKVELSRTEVSAAGASDHREVDLPRTDAFTFDASDIQRDPELSRNERSGDVAVTFQPPTAGVFSARLSLDSNGSEEDVALRGRGVYTLSATAVSLSGPGLQWDEPLDHGSVPVAGGESVRRLRVTNRTDGLVIIDPHWSRGQQGFTLRGETDDFRLGPGESRELTIVFDPEGSGSFQDTLVLSVDDSRVSPRPSVTRTRGGVVVTGEGAR